MTGAIKIYIGVAAGLVLLVAVTHFISSYRLRSMERIVEQRTAEAETRERLAADAVTRSAQYKEKIAWLESQIAGLSEIKRRQDESLKKAADHSRDARRDVERARGAERVDAGEAELCTKLAELGHPCE